MAVEGIFLELSLVFVIIVLVSAFMKLLKQPLIVGYIISGVLVSPHVFNIVSGQESAISTFAGVGVAFLLFLVGLHLNPKKMKEVGWVSLITGMGQVIFTCLGGFLLAMYFGFELVESLYIAIALTFSSTIIIMKLLSDNGDTDTLYGKISIGFLIVQDFVAMILLMVVAASVSDQPIGVLIVESVGILTLVILALLLVSRYALPYVMDRVADNQEFLLFFSAAWCLFLAAVFYLLGFSFEIGALLAGITLSVSTYRHQISSRMRVLRDFLLVLFFVGLGANMLFDNFFDRLIPVLIFSAFVLIGNPLIVMTLMGLLGYRKRTGFMAGLTVAQISEFSLILVALGVNNNQIGDEILSFVTLIGIITIAGSSYFISYNKQLYAFLEPYLSIFEKRSVREKEPKQPKEYDILLFGYHRVGEDLVALMEKAGKEVLIIDYNPKTVKKLKEQNKNVIYGDGGDLELLMELDFTKPKVLVSTIPNQDTNSLIVKTAKKKNPGLLVMCMSFKAREALELYEHGADYVIVPHFVSGKYAAKLLTDKKLRKDKFKNIREEHLLELKDKEGPL